MKRILCILLALCLLAAFSACGKPGAAPQTDPPAPVTQPRPEATESPEISDQTEPAATEAPAATEPPAAKVEVLNLTSEYHLNYQWDDATMLAISEHNIVTMWVNDVDRYPKMAKVLAQKASMQKKAMDEEYDNLLSFAREAASGDFETQTSKIDVQVRRADSVAVSLLSDSWSDYGWIDDLRAMHGSNYDTATGRELVITDVVKDMTKIPDIVMEELYGHMWYGELSSDTAVADYFRDTPVDGLSWTLDYNGVTFYFNDGDLEEPGNGCLTATVSFAEYPELFEEKYMAVPESYAVELPLDESYFTDLDGDGDLEELQVTGWYDTVMDMYAKYGIYSDADGSFLYEDYCCDKLHPYYVKTADGGHYLYLFCQFNEGPFPQMSLVAYDISCGYLSSLGDKPVGPGYIPENINRLPLNPESMWLDDYPGMAQDAMEFEVGADGMPALKGESAVDIDLSTAKMSEADEASLDGSSWVGYTIVNPESEETFPMPYTDPDGKVVTASMELAADGTGWLEFAGEYENITWDCDGGYSLWIIREDGQRADLTPHTMDGDSGLWLLADLEGYLFWLHEA